MRPSLVLVALLLPLTGCATPLLKAVRAGDHALAKRLLSEGADPDKGALDHPPLHDAVWMGDVEMARVLFDAGAKDKTFNLMYNAVDSGNPKMVDFLVERGYDPEAVRGTGDMTALGWAIYLGKAKVARHLLRKGSDPIAARAGLGYYASSNVKGWRDRGERGLKMLAEMTGAGPARAERPSLSATPAAGRVSKDELAEIVAAAVEGARRKDSPDGSKPRTRARGASSVGRPAYRSRPRPDDFAVVVGIEGYSDLPEALYAEADAAAVKEHLLALGVPRRNIILLQGSKAGRSSLSKYLEAWLPKNVSAESRVYFYFSGHGAPDPASGMAYLLPWDGDPSFLENTAYPVEKLYAGLKKLKAKEVIVALDACFSGAGGRSVLAKGARPLVTSVDLGTSRGQALTTFTAARADEITSTIEEQGHGIFTYYFLKGLNGAGEDGAGRVTSKSLYRYLKPHVQDEARRQNRSQTPTIDYLEEIAIR